jgi:D-amino-acid dehydrogenase
MRHVCVIGAGIVGSATAYALAREGWRVTLIDALHAAGQGASLSNGAQLSYSYVEPLATPAALRDLPAWLLSADSPMRWRPRPEWAHLRWLMAFVQACRWPRVQRSTEALLALSFLSRDTLHAWLNELPASVRQAVQHSRPGKLVLYRDPAKRAAAQRQLEWQRARAGAQRLVDADECTALEPALAATGGGEIAFGVWTESEEVVDAAALAATLAQASGTATVFGREVLSFEQRHGRIRAVQLDGGEHVAADHFVLAAGARSGTLMRSMGMRLPIEPIKGYSITLPVVNAAAAPVVSITDHGRRMVHARLGNRLRSAGFAELCGFDPSVQARRIAALQAAVQVTFPGACRFDECTPWSGLRPATPTGLPLVSPTRWGNLWLNTGHGGLGLTLAAGSAALLTSLMAERSHHPIDPGLYRGPR